MAGSPKFKQVSSEIAEGNDLFGRLFDDAGDDLLDVPPESSKEKETTQTAYLENFLGTLGRIFAVAYGGLCGMGINARVLAAFDSLPLAYAIGSATFFVNVVLFWTIVPAMLIKLFVKQDLFDESFPAMTRTGQHSYVKFKRNNGLIEKLKFWPWEKGFSIRAWIVLSFVAFFGLCAGLAYTGLLMSTLPGTLATLGLAPFLPMGLTLGFFFGVSALSNWFFNSYDAAEQFAKYDFFKKLHSGFFQLIGYIPNQNLLVGNETLQTVGYWSMKARQFVRLAIFAGITYLGVYAVYAIAHLGTQGLFSYLMPGSITGADGIISIAQYGASWIQALKWTVIPGAIVGAGFLYGVQLTRFSNYATQILTKIAQHYVSFADRAPNAFLKGICLTLLSPFIVSYMAVEGLCAAAEAEANYASNAWSRASNATPAMAVPTFFYHLIHNNMHALAVINASAQGLLAIKPGDPISQGLEEFAGAASASMMCYANKLGQDTEIAEGRATNTQEVVEPRTYDYLTINRTPGSKAVRFSLDNLDGSLSRELQYAENTEKFIVDPNRTIRARFEV